MNTCRPSSSSSSFLPYLCSLFAVSLLLASCEVTVDIGGPAPGQDLYGQLDLVTTDTFYRENRYLMINESAYPTALSDTDVINVFVDDGAAYSYSQIDPETEGTQVELPVGATIIREVLRDGELTKLTAMIKGPPGYFPEGGDYFYAVTSVDGSEILLDDAGNPLAGRLAVCGSCHAGRPQDDFLFGVVQAQQTFHSDQ